VGQPTIGVGVNQFGAYAGGSTSLFFSDMLGNHKLGVVAQINGGIQDIAGLVQYANLSKRFDWAVGVQHIPYITGGTFNRYRDTVDGFPVIVDDYLLERQTSTGTVAIGSLPFNRAQRFEVQGGYQRIGFSLQRRKEYYLEDGSYLGGDKEDLGHPYEPLHQFSTAAALVHDTSLFGPTSPITGSRARLEVSPSFGTIQYTSMLADARAYFMPVRPITFAFRAMHLGRYGSGSEDERFRSLFIGYPDLIRGYYEINSEDCNGIEPQATACPSYDRLFGSRMVVANAELRAPLVGLFRGKLEYGRVPVEVALFADAGVAWTSADKAAFLGGDRAWVRSAGVAVRVNVFGIMVVETAYARPFDRLSKGWVWSWSFTPGF
jgi:outer membrane protein assembly factor BamA